MLHLLYAQLQHCPPLLLKKKRLCLVPESISNCLSSLSSHREIPHLFQSYNMIGNTVKFMTMTYCNDLVYAKHMNFKVEAGADDEGSLMLLKGSQHM